MCICIYIWLFCIADGRTSDHEMTEDSTDPHSSSSEDEFEKIALTTSPSAHSDITVSPTTPAVPTQTTLVAPSICKILEDDLEEHKQICMNRPIQCDICMLEIPFHTFETHTREQASYHIQYLQQQIQQLQKQLKETKLELIEEITTINRELTDTKQELINTKQEFINIQEQNKQFQNEITKKYQEFQLQWNQFKQQKVKIHLQCTVV